MSEKGESADSRAQKSNQVKYSSDDIVAEETVRPITNKSEHITQSHSAKFDVNQPPRGI